MSILKELLALNEVSDFGHWFSKQGKKEVTPPSEPESDRDVDKIVWDVYKKLKDLGVKNIIRGVVDSWLLGGGYNTTDFIEQLEKLGYDSGWSTYEENADFWKKLGVSKSELEKLADHANGED